MTQWTASEQETDSDFDPFAGPAIARAVSSTEAQREIWTAAQLEDGASLAYNEAVVLRLAGVLDVPALRAALHDVVQRHESLRASFSVDGQTMLIAECLSLDVPVHDLHALDDLSRTLRRAAILEASVRAVFVLESGPLFRAALLHLAPDEHELLLSAHHVICDGWSFGVIASELAACYSARRRGDVAALPDVDSFSDFARVSAEALHSARREADVQYWLDQFADASPVVDLPIDRARPATRTFEAGREDRLVPAPLAKEIRDAGARAGSSMFATLFAGYVALLHRLTLQDDVVIGVPLAGQAADRPGLVGHCVNMLPIRVRPVGTSPVEAFIQSVRDVALDAFEHQQVGFCTLVQRLALPRTAGRVPLISVLFNLDRALPSSAMSFDGLRTDIASVPRTYESSDLFLNVVETPAGLLLECQYNRAMLDATTVARWLESYELLMQAMVTRPEASIDSLALLTAADRKALADCNDTGRSLPPETCVHAMFEAQVRSTPSAVAIAYDGTTVDYAELNGRANRLARHLRASGVRAGALVGICLDRTPDLVVALLATLKAGAGYVPLDPTYPLDRLTFMAGDAGLAVLLTDGRLASELRLPAAATIDIDAEAALIGAHADSDMPVSAADAQAEDIAYVIYTSGSTGTPKGVLVPHRAVVNLLASARREPGLQASDHVLAITTLSFDIAVSEVLLPLTVGARIVLASRDTAADGALLMQLIESAGVTFIDATPATYRLLLSSGWRGDQALRVICTGEAMPRDLAETLTRCVGEVWNGYGPTETTVWSTFARVTSPVATVLIGRPIANTVVQILDACGQQVPIGVPGELLIGGRGVSKGYLNRPDLTASRFVADPANPGALVYRTGDLVRLLASGELECLGRNDNQIKVRGFRIEPGEIEVVLARHPGVIAASVIAREDRANDVRLVAYLVTTSDAVISDALRIYAKGALPDYMLPSAYVRMEALPLTPSGKVDHRALPAPDPAHSTIVAAAFDAPVSETEVTIARVWADVLGMEQVSVTADFFMLGGHSLLVSQVLARLRRDHGIQLSFRKIFEAPTVRALAALADASRLTDTHTHAVTTQDTIPHRPDALSAPLSVLQERLWLLEELEPTQRAAHSHSASWKLHGSLNTERLERALHALIARHESLRTNFRLVDGERRQVVSPVVSFVLDRRDLSALDTDAQQVALADYFREQQNTTFDLDVAPLYRACLFRIGDEAHLLYTLQHGMVWDGWSFDLSLSELSERYAADEQGRVPQCSALPLTYGDFAEWQSRWVKGAEAAQQTAWWRAQLAGDLQELALPTDFPRPARSSHAGSQIRLPFGTGEAEQLRSLARRYDATLFMVLFAAYNVVLHHYTGQDDLLVGSPVRARTRPELEGIIGPFVNTVMLRTRVVSSMTFPELLRAVRDTTLDSFSHQELPFELLGTRVPPLRALFSMQDARERPNTMGTVRVEQYHVPQHFTTNDLMLWMMDSSAGLYAVLNYSTELFHRITAEQFLSHLRAFLRAVQENPERTIGDIELSQVPVPLPTAVPAREHEALATTIERVTRAQPDAPALRDSSIVLSRAELSERTRRIAAGLRAAGVADGSAVAIALPVGVDRVVATVAVLCAGGAVALLDPLDPTGWKQQVTSAVDARLVIVESAAAWTGMTPALTMASLLAYDATSLADIASPPQQAVLLATPAVDGSVSVVRVDASMLLSHVRDLVDELLVTPRDVVLSTMAAGTPAAVIEMLMAVTAGATLVVASDDAREDGHDLEHEARACAATVVCGSAEVWHRLLATRFTPPTAFRGLVICNELLPGEVVQELTMRVPAAWTMLSLGAGGGASGVQRVREDDGVMYLSADGMSAAVLDVVDASLRESPAGIPGQLRVTSRDSTTLLPLRARRVADGRLQLLVTETTLLSLDGITAPAPAVEQVIASHQTVTDAAVAVRRDASGAVRLVAWVVARPGTRPVEMELRATVRARLPRRCVPQRIVIVDALPRNSTGQVQYAALPSPFVARGVAGMPHVAPRSEVETMLAVAWTDALGVEQVSVHDNFFALGGTSLLCFRVVERVRRATGQHLNPRALLVGTLEQAAAELSSSVPTSNVPPANVVESRVGVFARLRGLIS